MHTASNAPGNTKRLAQKLAFEAVLGDNSVSVSKIFVSQKILGIGLDETFWSRHSVVVIDEDECRPTTRLAA